MNYEFTVRNEKEPLTKRARNTCVSVGKRKLWKRTRKMMSAETRCLAMMYSRVRGNLFIRAMTKQTKHEETRAMSVETRLYRPSPRPYMFRIA
jgi:hypothetical protein